MSIDYDELREWLAMVERENRGRDGVVEFTYPGNTVEIIHELIRLHDGSSQLLAKKRAAVKRLYSTDQITAAVLEVMCDELENLLEGDTE